MNLKINVCEQEFELVTFILAVQRTYHKAITAVGLKDYKRWQKGLNVLNKHV